MSISEMRTHDVHALAKLADGGETEENINKARRLMNSYYRLCGLCETNLYLTNNERTCDRESTRESEERENKWYKRLAKQFEEFCGYTLKYCGYYPNICHTDERGCVFDVLEPHFYN